MGSLAWLWDAGVVAQRMADGWHLVRVEDDRQLGVLSSAADVVACCLTPVAGGVERALAVGLTVSPAVTTVGFGTLRVRWRQEVTVPAVAIGHGLWAAEAVGQFDIATLRTAASAVTVRLDASHRHPGRPRVRLRGAWSMTEIRRGALRVSTPRAGPT